MISRPNKEQLAQSYGKTIRDVIAPNLSILFVGINPSLYSAAVGHHFARPGNRFWPALYKGKVTPRLFAASEDHLLVDYDCGLTNIVARATARADELSDEELKSGATKLIRKVKRYQPACVAFVGITSYRTAFDRKEAKIGQQKETIGDSILWVLPNPSGLNAHYQIDDFAKLFARLKESIGRQPRRKR